MFTNEEKKQFQYCTVEDQQEIFEAFQKQITKLEIWSIMFQKWSKVISNLDREGIYRVVPQKEEDSSERATPIKGIPWEVIDSKWNWAAMDNDGCICLYDNKPKRLSENWAYAGAEDDYFYVQGYFKLDTTEVEWNTSLTKRPKHC